ncbi:MAG: hypothetical protein ACTSVV_08950 [Promethearchaeota archaeon]
MKPFLISSRGEDREKSYHEILEKKGKGKKTRGVPSNGEKESQFGMKIST